MARWLARLAAAGMAMGLGVAQTQTLTVHYQERPPYSSTGPDGTVRGLVADPVETALAAAGIAHRWAVTPSQRQLALIQSAPGLHCGVGWFRTDERAARGRFSRPLYQDRPWGALVRDGSDLHDGLAAPALVADTRYTPLVKDGYSYGDVLDALLARRLPPPLPTSVDPVQMSRMLRSGRADWMIVAPEEAAVLGGDGLRLIELSGLPPGPVRHLYCGTGVPAAWMQRIDHTLARGAR